ncbi:hypothetical protein [Cryptosporangium minutisporangium]|uniref:Uncharacterized protein n=1 Tax=Cryptosporangium minutisporangium TaxID=113569 RepID=A0ABP6ST50_9ACTN
MGSLGTTDIADPPAARPALDWPTTAPPAPQPATKRSSRRPQLVSALVGLLVGALVVGGIWLAGALRTEPAVGPSADAAMACAILERLPEFTAGSLGSSNSARLYAASELSAAAATADQRYRGLADATRRASLSSSDLDADSVNRQVSVALTECRG